MTFGRWCRKDGKSHFVTGPIPVSAQIRKQPELELFAWQEFLDHQKEVPVAPLMQLHEYKRC
jgi:hypothetical protein